MKHHGIVGSFFERLPRNHILILQPRIAFTLEPEVSSVEVYPLLIHPKACLSYKSVRCHGVRFGQLPTSALTVALASNNILVEGTIDISVPFGHCGPK